ncbi:DUF3450 family protein [Pseudoalteromonas xiamenensis]
MKGMGKSKKAILIVTTILAMPVLSVKANNQADSMPNLVEKWLQLSAQQQRVESEWAAEKPLLEQQLQLLQQEFETLNRNVSSKQGGQSEVAQKRESLASEQQRLEKQQFELQSALKFHRKQLSQIVSRLPPVLQNAWNETLLKWQGDISAQTDANQLQDVLALYQQWADFQKRIVVHEAPIQLNGEEFMVDQLYVGVSQAWFISKDGKTTGVGAPKGTSWVWTAVNDLDTAALVSAIAMYRKQQPASLIQLPYVATPTLGGPSNG